MNYSVLVCGPADAESLRSTRRGVHCSALCPSRTKLDVIALFGYHASRTIDGRRVNSISASKISEEAYPVRANEPSEEDLLNRLAAIQAAAEILDDNDDLSPTDRRLFLSVIRTETSRLHRIFAS